MNKTCAREECLIIFTAKDKRKKFCSHSCAAKEANKSRIGVNTVKCQTKQCKNIVA